MTGIDFSGQAARRSGALATAGRGALIVVTVPVAVLGGLGWCYATRSLGWLAAGPRIGDALPLLQLARFDGQPLLRVAVAWLLAGGVAGLLLASVPRLPRAALAGTLGGALLLLDAQASYALTRNLRFDSVLLTHAPGVGPWLATGLFALACAVPGPLRPHPATGRSRISL